jgi:antitoxin MazE
MSGRKDQAHDRSKTCKEADRAVNCLVLSLPGIENRCIIFVDTSGGVQMLTRVKKWGNSLAIRIPKPLANEVGLEQDTPVEVSLADGKLVVMPVHQPALSLEQLLAGVTEDNLHREVDTGPAVGHEVW